MKPCYMIHATCTVGFVLYKDGYSFTYLKDIQFKNCIRLTVVWTLSAFCCGPGRGKKKNKTFLSNISTIVY